MINSLGTEIMLFVLQSWHEKYENVKVNSNVNKGNEGAVVSKCLAIGIPHVGQLSKLQR